MPPNELNALNYPPETTTTSLESEEDCCKIIESLTEDELDEAANASYAYYMSTTKNSSTRTSMAMKMAKRHLIAEKFNHDKALVRMKNALQFRKETKINELRLAFSTQTDENQTNENQTLQSHIKSETSKQSIFIRGYDKQNHAILIKQDRTHPETDKDAYFLTNIYMLERAIACTEQKSNGTQDKIVVVLNYGNYVRANVPPMKMIKEFISVMERNYPEVLEYLVLVDVPFYFRGIWYILKPFIDPDTVQKIRFVTGEEQRVELLGPLIDDTQAMPFLLPDGKLTSSIDMSHFLGEVPFHLDHDQK